MQVSDLLFVVHMGSPSKSRFLSLNGANTNHIYWSRPLLLTRLAFTQHDVFFELYDCGPSGECHQLFLHLKATFQFFRCFLNNVGQCICGCIEIQYVNKLTVLQSLVKGDDFRNEYQLFHLKLCEKGFKQLVSKFKLCQMNSPRVKVPGIKAYNDLKLLKLYRTFPHLRLTYADYHHTLKIFDCMSEVKLS